MPLLFLRSEAAFRGEGGQGHSFALTPAHSLPADRRSMLRKRYMHLHSIESSRVDNLCWRKAGLELSGPF